MSNCLKGVPKELTDELNAAPDKKAFIRDLKAQNARKYKLMKMTHQKQLELTKLLDEHPKGAVSALRSILTNDVYGLAKNSNIEYRTSAIVGQTHAQFVDLIAALSTRKFGLTRDVKLADDVVREIFGTATKNEEATLLAAQWGEASASLRERFNDAGGAIDKLETWGMPQSHNQPNISKAGADVWVEFVKPLLKNGDELDLAKVYETIATGGANKLRENSLDAAKHMGGGKMLANKNNDPRSLHFKDADSWLNYQKKFGQEDPLSTMLDHVRVLSNDVAMVEILGPNPDNMFKTLVKEVNLRETLDGGQSGWEGYTQAIYNVVAGEVDSSAASSIASSNLEKWFGTARSFQTASKLGSATLSAMADMGTMFTNVAYHGMSPAKILKSFVKNFDVKSQIEIARLGFAADIFNSTLSSRFTEMGHGASAKMAEGVIRASGLSMWTEAARKSFQYEFYNHLKDLKSQSAELPDLFKQYGFSKADFDALDFDNLSTMQQTRILEMVNQETDYAVLMPTARTRATTTGGHKKGTWTGELFRSASMFKSFPVSFMVQQMSRVFLQSSLESRVKYGLTLFTSTTILGGLAMTAKDASKGYGPRDGNPLDDDSDLKEDAKWWAAAAIQGGGAGIFGDLLFSDQNRFGGGAATTVAGPLVGAIDGAMKLTFGNIQQALDPERESSNFGSEAVGFASRELSPMNLWYTKALMEKICL